MSFHAEGTFAVDSWEDQKPAPVEGREVTYVIFTRVYSGDLSGSGQCHSSTSSTGSGFVGRVGIELVEGSLHGRTGGFRMTYRSQYGEAAPWLHWNLHDGTGELAGITGDGRIVMTGDECTYAFDYDFADPADRPRAEDEPQAEDQARPKRHFWQRDRRG